MSESYMQQIRDIAVAKPFDLPHVLGLGSNEFEFHGNGADHHDLFQIKPRRWIVPLQLDKSIGYTGISVHWEMERPGYLVLHCEPHERLSRKKDKDPELMRPLQCKKAELTSALRKALLNAPDGSLLIDTKRCRDPQDISGNKVVGFDLGLDASHSPRDAVIAICIICRCYNNCIDRIIS